MNIYKETNIFLEQCFHILEAPIPSPVPMKLGNHLVLRYSIQSLETAIIQKQARYVSGLNASLVLLERGYTQELGALFRTLDEFSEDIIFLALPITGDIEITETHTNYLKYFFQEEFDKSGNAFLSGQKRPTIPRKKIRAIISKFSSEWLNQHDSQELSRTISQAYSGYVHGASCHICEMVGGKPLKYYLSGMKGTYRQIEFANNYWDYAYRGLLSNIYVAKALGNTQIIERTYKFIDYFEKATGETGSGDTDKLLRKMKQKKA